MVYGQWLDDIRIRLYSAKDPFSTKLILFSLVKFHLKKKSFKIVFTTLQFLLFSSNFLSVDYSSKSLLNHQHDYMLNFIQAFHRTATSLIQTLDFSQHFLFFFHDQSFFWLLANKLPFPVCSIEWSNWSNLKQTQPDIFDFSRMLFFIFYFFGPLFS